MRKLNPAFCPYCHDTKAIVFPIDDIQNIGQCTKCGRYVKDGKWGTVIFTAYSIQAKEFNPSRRTNT